MAKTIDLVKLRKGSLDALHKIVERIDTATAAHVDYDVIRWICAMSAVEAHAIWERFAENRLAAALNHFAKHFIDENNIRGVKHVSSGLAFYVVRSGGKFFDFRSMEELKKKSDKLVGKTNNPFSAINGDDEDYLDTLAIIRNTVVHNSDAAWRSYKTRLREQYDIRSAPEPDEFLGALDKRPTSPLRGRKRIEGLISVVTT